MYSTTPFIIANRELKPYEIERRTSISIERWLKDKFREGFKQLKKEFIREDTESTGKVSSCFFRESIFHNMAQYLLFFSFSNDIFFSYTNDKKTFILQVSRDVFRRIIAQYGLYLRDEASLNMFLARCNLTPRGEICYQDLLNRFQDRSDTGIAHNILSNPKHRYVHVQFSSVFL